MSKSPMSKTWMLSSTQTLVKEEQRSRYLTQNSNIQVFVKV